MGYLEGSGVPVLYIGRTVTKVNTVVRLVIRILYCPVQIPKYYIA
jgi:hypothetical protein